MKVWPKDDRVRKFIKHPTGIAFREKGSADWPPDAFTFRRLAAGVVLQTDPNSQSPKPPPQPPSPLSSNKDT